MVLQDIEKDANESIKTTTSSSSGTDLLDLESADAVLAKKMKLINNAIDEIGFTPYHLKLFFLNGMGYATDSQLLTLESTVRTFIAYQFAQDFPISNEAMVIGGIVGACFWGYGADIIGRKTAFNCSLFLSGLFVIITGAMNSLATYCLFIALSAFAFGGNLVLDTCVFLEFLPFRHQWLVTFFALFWGIGQTVCVLIAWAFLPNFSCEGPDPAHCDSKDNRGWRYTFYVNGAIVLILAVARVTFVRLQESPKFLVCNNRDEEAFECLKRIAEKYNRKFTLTLDQLIGCGDITANHGIQVEENKLTGTFKLVRRHLAAMFENKTMARNTATLFLSWLILGICYPIYYAFLPVYLATRGDNISASTVYGVYRDNVVSNVCSIGGPIIAGALLYFFPRLGYKGVLTIGAFVSSAFFFGYTGVRNHAANLAVSSLAYAALYIYFGTQYSYSPSVFPSSIRSSGNACCIMITRFGQIFSPIIAYYSNTSSPTPLYVCGALMAINGFLAISLPFDPSKNRPS